MIAAAHDSIVGISPFTQGEYSAYIDSKSVE
jgi:hypothetical protein